MAAAEGKTPSGLPPGDRFAMGFWKPCAKVYGVSWDEFQEWELWRIAGALELDRRDPTDDELAFIEAQTSNVRKPSADRKG